LVFIDVTVTIKSRIVTVKGPRGTITKPFNHKAIEIKIMNEATKNRQGKHIRLRMWNASYRESAAVTTFKSLIANMLTGCTEVSIHKSIQISPYILNKSLLKAIAHTPLFGVFTVLRRNFPFQFLKIKL